MSITSDLFQSLYVKVTSAAVCPAASRQRDSTVSPSIRLPRCSALPGARGPWSVARRTPPWSHGRISRPLASVRAEPGRSVHRAVRSLQVPDLGSRR